MSQLKDAGTPDPLDFRRARPIRGEAGEFAVGSAISSTVPTVALVPIAGALVIRIRGKFTTTEAAPPSPMGVLSFTYRRSPPDHDTAYSTSLAPPHADVPVVKDTEFLIDIEPIGESLLAITFTPDGGVDPAKVISPTFFDQMQQ